MRSLNAVGNVIGCVRYVVAGNHQFRLGAGWQRILSEVTGLSDLCQVHPCLSGPRIAYFTILERQRVSRSLQNRRRKIKNIRLQRLANLQCGFTAHRHPARRLAPPP